MENYGIRGIEGSLLQSYLTDRSRYVQTGSMESSRRNNSVGVPRIFILRPALFVLYINDLAEYLPEKKPEITLYAFDTTIMVIDEEDSITKLTGNLQ